MTLLTEQERSFVYSLFNDLYQNYASRSIEPDLLASILGKLQNTSLNLTSQESRRIQYALVLTSERYQKLADQTIQFILNPSNTDYNGSRDSFFNGPAMYNLSKAVLAKLEAGL